MKVFPPTPADSVRAVNPTRNPNHNPNPLADMAPSTLETQPATAHQQPQAAAASKAKARVRQPSLSISGPRRLLRSVYGQCSFAQCGVTVLFVAVFTTVIVLTFLGHTERLAMAIGEMGWVGHLLFILMMIFNGMPFAFGKTPSAHTPPKQRYACVGVFPTALFHVCPSTQVIQ